MSSVLVPKKTKQGWIIDIPNEFAEALGVTAGSMAVLYANDGKINYEILPPPAPELEAEFQAAFAELEDTFVEMKRLGD